MSRTKNAIKNAGFGIAFKILNTIVSFVSRTVFIGVLGSTYLGINGLFTEVLGFLSFAELGFGSAMTFSMYKPVATGDRKRTIQLLDFYKHVYRIIALIIFVLGVCIVPFIDRIVKGAEWISITDLQIYFLIFLFNTVIGYFVTYKYAYINALQKNYISNNIDSVVTLLISIMQILAILLTRNFLLYLLIGSFILLCSRLFIIIYLNKKYPILKEKPDAPLSKQEINPIINEVKGLAIHQFASAAVHSTDNMIISSMINVAVVGLVSNYSVLINSVLSFVKIIFNSVVSGFGNLVAESNIDNYRKVFKEVNFVNFWIYGFCSIAFWVLIPPFISLWIGSDKLIDNISFTLIIINVYLQGQCTAYNNARIAKGNFGKDKWLALLQALVNLIVSLCAAKQFGLVGVYIGTISSRMVYVVFRPYSTYYFLFEESVTIYYRKFIEYFIEVICVAFITKTVVDLVLCELTIMNFIFAVFLVAIIPNLCFLLCNFKTREFEMLKERVIRIMSSLKSVG